VTSEGTALQLSLHVMYDQVRLKSWVVHHPTAAQDACSHQVIW
jgi:hypothetical protein